MNREELRQSLRNRIRPYEGRYLHSISLNNFNSCNNLSLSGRLFSSEMGAVIDDGLWSTYVSARDIPMQILATNPPEGGVVQAFAFWRVWVAAVIRRGGHVAMNQLDPVWLPHAEELEILRAGDAELVCEETRRRIAPDAASRLTSLYVVDDNPSGQRLLRFMFGRDRDRYQVKVIIPAALRVSRVDSRWFDRFQQLT